MAAPFYSLQAMHEAQDNPVQYDTTARPMPPIDTSRYSLLGGTGLDENLGAGLPDTAPQPAAGPGYPGASMTLEQMNMPAAEAASAPGAPGVPPALPPLEDRLRQYMDFAEKAVAPERVAKFTSPPKPTVAQWILSMGTAGLAAHEYANRWNVNADAKNRALEAKKIELARQLMASDSNLQMAQANYGLNLQRMNLAQLQAFYKRDHDQLTELQKSLYPVPTEAQTAGADEQGMHFEPAGAGAPGRFRLAPGRKAPGASGAAPGVGGPAPDPRSPIGAALGASPEASAAAPGAPGAPGARGGFAGLADRKAQAKADSAKVIAEQEITPRLDRLYREFDNLKTAAGQVLPHLGSNALSTAVKGQIGGRYNLYTALKSHDPAKRAAGQAMRNSARSIFALIFGEAGGTKGIRITFPEIETFKEPLKGVITGSTTVEEAQSTLDDLTRYLRENDPRNGSSTTTPTTTPGTTTTTQPDVSGGAEGGEEDGGFQTTPSGRRFRVL